MMFRRKPKLTFRHKCDPQREWGSRYQCTIIREGKEVVWSYWTYAKYRAKEDVVSQYKLLKAREQNLPVVVKESRR